MAPGAPVTVALDGRGADGGARVIAEGARLAAERGHRLRVFGDLDALASLAELEAVELVEAPQEVGNDEEPVAAVRAKERSSISLAANDVSEGRSAALVSAGSTGATLAACVFALRRMRGVRRPALLVELPAPEPGSSPTRLIDAGANAEARAGDLVQSAHIGAAFTSAVHGIERPRVGLLSVGEEAKKGTPEVAEAHAILAGQKSGFEFLGNVEGRDLIGDVADVVVSDGFTGNIALKAVEGTALAIGRAVRAAARSGPISAAGGLLMRPALGELRSRMDPDNTGGAILLGLRGIAVVAHGSSGPEGIANAISLAQASVRDDVVARTERALAEAGASRRALADQGVIGRGNGADA